MKKILMTILFSICLLNFMSADCAEIDSSIMLLEDNGEFLATLPYLIQKGDYEAASELLATYGSNLSEEELQLNTLNIEKLIDSTGWNTIDSTQTDYLIALAESECGLSAIAKAILYLAKGIEYPEILLDIDITEESRSEEYKKPRKTFSVTGNYFDLFPNPTSDLVSIVLQDGEWMEENILVEVYNALGKKVSETTFKGEEKTVSLSFVGLAKGIYNVRLKTGADSFLDSKTFILQ